MPAAVEHCVKRLISSLTKRYPNKTASEIEQMAWGICNKLNNEGKLCEDGACSIETGDMVW
jgi:hypothetical protein